MEESMHLRSGACDEDHSRICRWTSSLLRNSCVMKRGQAFEPKFHSLRAKLIKLLDADLIPLIAAVGDVAAYLPDAPASIHESLTA